MRAYDLLSVLPLTVDGCRLEGRSSQVSGDFVRHTTVVRLEGAGHVGLGEDVNYDAAEQQSMRRSLIDLDLTGSFTLESLSRRLERSNLFPHPPRHEASRDYRRWAFESAALDLALRQSDTALHTCLGRRPRPVRFVVSPSLGRPAALEPLARLLERDPGLRFKLDAGPGWDAELLARLAATGAVDVVDFKGAYRGTPVDQLPDATLYERVALTLPDAWLEDPALTEETRPVLAPHMRRVTWDAPIHSVADIEAVGCRPEMLNMKPSRFGSLANLFDAYDHCAGRRIGMYGGGQFELGPGRGQVQYLAALFHPDSPNDVAPREFNVREPAADLPSSPLAPQLAERGFRWAEEE